MLNRRILRIKAFKTLYSSVLSGNKSLSESELMLDQMCEATRDLYIYMLGIVSPLTSIAKERIENARSKFNPTYEEANPNTKFADNALAVLLDNDVDFQKIFAKKKFSWSQYDLLHKKIMDSVVTKDYYIRYMSSPERSLSEDCRLFTKIFEEELVDSQELEHILEEKSLYWYEDLPYALTWCCKTLRSLGEGAGWSLLPLYHSEMISGDDVESDRFFVRKLLKSSYSSYEQYSSLIAESVQGWEKDRLFSTDVLLIVMGLAEAVSFPAIPVKVTINEYVEISKFFGTQKSRAFVNGLLDSLVQKFVSEGMIVKSGKGLL